MKKLFGSSKLFVFLIITSFFLVFCKSTANSDSLDQVLSDTSTENQKSLIDYIQLIDSNKNKAPDSALLYAQKAFDIINNNDPKNSRALLHYHYAHTLLNIRKYDEAIKYFDKALNLFIELDDSLWISRTYNRLANAYQFNSDYRNAYYYYIKAYDYIKNNQENKNDIASVLSSLSNVYRLFGDHEKAIQSLQEAQKYYEETNYKEGHAWLAFLLAKYYMSLKDYSNAVKSCKESFTLYQELAEADGIYSGVVMTLTLLTRLYTDMNDAESALETANKTLEISQEHKIIPGIADTYGNIGKILYNEKKYNQSIQALKQSLSVKKEINDNMGQCNTHLDLAKNYFKLNDFQSTMKHLNISKKIADKNNFIIYLQSIYYEYSLLYENQNQFDSALFYYKKHIIIKDSINSKEISEKVAGLNLKYETEKKERENIILKKNNQIQKQTIERQKSYLFVFSIIILIVTLSVINFIRDKKKLKKVNMELAEKNSEIFQKNKIITEKNENLNSVNVELAKLNENLKMSNYELYKISITDELTNIYNRSFLFQKLEKELKRALRHNFNLSCLIIDIDHFKNINDQFGHLVGDFILKDMCRVILNNIRDEDIFGRYGGEEFLIILPHTNLEHAFLTAEKIRKKISSENFQYKNQTFHITISCGISEIQNGNIKNIDSIIKTADDALYLAKKSGRNQCLVLSSNHFNSTSVP